MTEGHYRDKQVVDDLTRALTEAADGLPTLRIMHVCGTHEHEVSRYGIRQLLPPNVTLIAGPGCPVCITPASVIATARTIALHADRPVICTYGDMVRVPIADGSLLDTRGDGADVRVVYGIREAVAVAADNPGRRVVFFSVGFETTAAPVAAIVRTGLPDNLLLYCCHRYVPTAVEALCAGDDGSIGGFLLPGHATVITGTAPYRFIPETYGHAAAVAGFEPVEILTALLSIARQVRGGMPEVANCYSRVVRDGGNTLAQEAIDTVFETTDAAWRGIGVLPGTGLSLRPEYRDRFDAIVHYGMNEVPAADVMKGCICHLVVTGRAIPGDCPLFGTACTPLDPQGPCMVGGEGTCRAHYLYGGGHTDE